MGLRQVTIGGFIIVVGIFLASGIGDEFGVFENTQDFTDTFDSNFSDTGIFVNMEENSETQLVISDPTVNGANIEDVKRLDIFSESEWLDNQQLTNFIVKDDGNDYYLTNDGTQNQNALYVTEEFFVDSSTDFFLEYAYREDTAPTSFTLTLRGVDNNYESTVNLQAGNSSNGYRMNETFTVNNNGSYEIELELEDGSEDEQRLYSLLGTQNASGLDSFGSGKYESDIIRTADRLQIEYVETLGNNIDSVGADQKRGFVTLYGIVDGDVTDTCEIDIESALNIYNEDTVCVEGNGYRFDVTLETEDGTDSPLLDSVEFTGTTNDRILSQDLTTPLQIIFLAIFTTLGIVLIAKGL